MSPAGFQSVQSQTFLERLIHSLAGALFEWFLMFTLFIDACFAYSVTKFARYCELQTPCLLCSRLDHVLGKETKGFYWGLMCRSHKLEISSLVLCHAHKKLVDVHGMCEHCLFSFAMINKSNAETYRLLVGIMGSDRQVGTDHKPLVEDQSLRRNCCCCNEQWILRGYAHNLLRTTSIRSDAAESETPMPVQVENVESKQTFGGGSLASLGFSQFSKDSFDPLPHMEDQKVNIHSDPESEATFSVDDNSHSLIRETDSLKVDFTLASDSAMEKLIPFDSVPETSGTTPEVHGEAIDPHGIVAATPTGHGLEKRNWEQVEHKADASTTAEIISFDEVPLSATVSKTLVKSLVESLAAGGTDELIKSVTLSRAISRLEGESITSNETSSELNLVSSANSLDLGDAYNIAIGSKGRQLSEKILEQRSSLKDSARVSEDLKLLLTQISAARGIELSLNDISPKLSLKSDELKNLEDSSIMGMHLLQRRISLERNESSLSLDGSTVSEIEGESIADRLKRQVEHDKKLMDALYKELEEERNASAIATNQAMAMITRLQEEKAALNMEALQCLRVMEEQAEYDNEALQKANGLLADKEKEIQDLEAELELYRKHNKSSKKSSFLEFEEERLYLLNCLKQLEKKLHQQSDSEDCLEVVNGDYSVKEEKGAIYDSNNKGVLETEAVDLRKEFADLSDRLATLEADCSFLEHSINLLKNGHEGLKFIQEIACHLWELHGCVNKR